MKFSLTHNLALAAVLSASLGLAACGGDSDSPAGSAVESNGKSNEIEGPLDVVQDEVITGVVGTQLGGSLPAPLGPTVQCAADAINSLVDAPDALLGALTAAAGGDPSGAFSGAADQIIGSLQRFASDLQSTLMALTGAETCDTVASGDSDGTPRSGNPLAGTELDSIGSALEGLTTTLAGFSGSAEDPNLTSVTDLVAPQLMALSEAFNLLPEQVNEAPVVGGLFATLRDATGDLAMTLPAIGDYDSVETNVGVELLLNNLLSNVLLRVIPVELIDEQTGQDFSSQIQFGIDMAVNTLGSVTDQLITPVFDRVLNGAASPLLDPVENLLAMLLGNVPAPGASTASGNPLTGLLGGLAGDNRGGPLDGLLGLLTVGADGGSMGDLTKAVGGDPNIPQLDQIIALVASGLPLDGLLGQLRDATAGIPIVGGVVSTVINLLDSVLGGGQG